MTGKQPKYDDSIELEVNALLCSLDKNPKVCINPVEASKYLNCTLAVSEEGFQQQIETDVERFLAYLNQFAKECIGTGAVKTMLLPTISRLLTQYKQAQYTFTHSPLRMEWKAFSTDYMVVNSTNDFNAAKEQKYYREAYNFFYKTSARQLFFINQLIDAFTVILEANDIDTTQKRKSETDVKEQPVLFSFTLRQGVSLYIHDVLTSIHKELKMAGYIDCTLPKFKSIFITDEQQPIIWLKPYSHLAYMLQRFGERILTEPKSPSNYAIAQNLFYDRKYGVFFMPYRDRPDGKLSPEYKAFFDRIIDGAVRNYM